MSTVFSSSPISPEAESQELSTLAAFVAHIERLQDQVRQKDGEILDVESALTSLQQKHDQLEVEHNATLMQAEIQNKLLKKTQQNDAHVEQLRAAVVNREAMISEKVKSIRAIERELEHHKLLLQAQIRRHATMTLHTTEHDDPLPELSTLKTRSDVNKWIEKLQERLKKEKPMAQGKTPLEPKDTLIADLRQEIDFYVREIIYYKLDIRGYKSDIKKLNRITAQLSSYGSRGDGSDTSSLRPAVTPSQAYSANTTPDIGTSEVPSPAIAAPFSQTFSATHPITPPLSGSAFAQKPLPSATETNSNHERSFAPTNVQFPMTPHQTPKHIKRFDTARKTGHIVEQLAPHRIVGFPSESKKPTVREPLMPQSISAI
jgi:hypothetical protein